MAHKFRDGHQAQLNYQSWNSCSTTILNKLIGIGDNAVNSITPLKNSLENAFKITKIRSVTNEKVTWGDLNLSYRYRNEKTSYPVYKLVLKNPKSKSSTGDALIPLGMVALALKLLVF